MTVASATAAGNPLPPPGGRATRKVRSIDLMGGAREIILLHEKDEYRLRVTRNEKLILTK